MSKLADFYDQAAISIHNSDYAGALSYLECALNEYSDDKKTKIFVELLRLKRLCEEFLSDE